VGKNTEITCTQTRFPKELWQSVKHAAVDMGTSANGALIILVEEALANRHALSHKHESLYQDTLRAVS
jgi:hypothetical protein